MKLGPVMNMPTLGRPGIVVGATPIGEARDGRQYVQVHVRTRVADGEAGAGGVPTAPTVAEAAKFARTAPISADCDSCGEPGRVKEDRLRAAEKAALDELRQRDGQVRQEEKAHAAAAGALAGAISYDYRAGPDGQLYAVSGKVPVSLPRQAATPEQLEAAAAQLAHAANAAVNPSAADMAIARAGYRTAGEAASAALESRGLDILG